MARIQHPTYDEWSSAYSKIRDVIKGEDRLKQQGQLYLPRPEGMRDGVSVKVGDGSFFIRHPFLFPLVVA